MYKKGLPYPLGATVSTDGVNFSVFSPFATKVELLIFKNHKDQNPKVFELYKSYHYWHLFLEGISTGTLYAFRADGKYEKQHRFDASKVLTDPYSKAIEGTANRKNAATFGYNNIDHCMKSVVIDDRYDWEGIERPEFPLEQAIIYEMHPAGFSKSIKTAHSGTFAGILDKIDHLKSLGINTIELMPIFAFDPDDAPAGKVNYWGYSPINFFSIHPNYCMNDAGQNQIVEFKNFVKKMHLEGFKIILDVVYNHSTENSYSDPTYNFRGLANSSYYITDSEGNLKDYSGCGNTINANHSVMRRMILDSLIYWHQTMQIDGFRFDLASILSRGEDGHPLDNPPLLWSIDSEPLLTEAFIIAEPWDAQGLNQVRNFPGDKWAIWNGEFRDVMRRFVKGDRGLLPEFTHYFLGSENIINSRYFKFSPKRNIHFITAHDGFTLHDLVSYNEKNNFENGENNRDGSDHDLSWNCGIEGETDDFSVLETRKRQQKNFLTILFLSHGIPMLLMGDEISRSQSGNNNAFCLDNEKSWINWEKVPENQELFLFTQLLISIRKKYKIFNYNDYYSLDIENQNPYVLFHGQKNQKPDWTENGNAIAMELIYPHQNEHFYLIFNMDWLENSFQLPTGNWKKILDTQNDSFDSHTDTQSVKLMGRSIVLYKKIIP